MYLGLSIIILLWLSLLLVNKLYQNSARFSPEGGEAPEGGEVPERTINNIKNNINLNIYTKLLLGNKQILIYSLFITIIIYYIVLYWYYIISGGSTLEYQLLEDIYNITLGLDSISIYLILLTAILLPICILGSWNTKWNKPILYNIFIIGLGILLLINFICLDLLSFYVFFESTLIPLFLLIGLYGSANKEKAAYYILLYTLYSSLFMLLSIVCITYLLGNTNYIINSNLILSIDLQMILWLGIFIAIMVKTPLWPLHIWLPVVHSESPLGGSILLAGLVLKLALYLILRWLLPILPEANILYTPIIYVLCLISIIYISMITIIQLDLKVIIAYSSISHMGVTLLGANSNNIIGINGSYVLGLAHGLVSPGLFICVGGILYDRYHTRVIYYYNELLSFMPKFSMYLLLLSFANIGTPLSINFIGEFLSLYGAFTKHPIIVTIASFGILLSATFQMRLTNRITSGISSYIRYTSDILPVESITMISILLPTLFLGIYPNTLLNSIYFTISSYIYII